MSNRLFFHKIISVLTMTLLLGLNGCGWLIDKQQSATPTSSPQLAGQRQVTVPRTTSAAAVSAHSPAIARAKVYPHGAPPVPPSSSYHNSESGLMGLPDQAALDSGGYKHCDIEHLLSLRSKKLLEYLVEVSGRCVNVLFRPHEASRELFQTTTLLEAAEIAIKKARSWEGKKGHGLWPLVTFIKAAYFVRSEFPEAGLEDFEAVLKPQVSELVDTLLDNAHLWKGGPALANSSSLDAYYSNLEGTHTVMDTLILADSIGEEGIAVKAAAKFFKTFQAHHKHTWAQYGLFPMQLASYRLHNYEGFSDRIDSGDAKVLKEELLRLVKDGKAYFADRQMFRNTLREVARFIPYFAKKPSLAEQKDLYSGQGQEIVTAVGSVLNASEKMSADWAEAIYSLNKVGKVPCERYRICEAEKEIRAKLFPYRWHFDDGKIVVATALPYSEVQPLFYAVKEVKAQFVRQTGVIDPVADDSNDTLTMVIFGRKEDYQAFQLLLHDLPSDNGGMYIESNATFYTFQRKVPQQSQFTLEELVRHEYVHYLTGRYLTPGQYGEGEFYRDKSRLPWFEEGIAEFLVGSTSRDGIQVRPKIVELLREEEPAWPRTPAVIMRSSYAGDSFRFYSHATLWFNYLYQKEPQQMYTLFKLMRQADVVGFDNWVRNMGKDTARTNAYFNFVEEQKKQQESLVQRENEAQQWPNATTWRLDNGALIQKYLELALGIQLRCKDQPDSPISLLRRFECKGVMRFSASDLAKAHQEVDARLDKALKNLERSSVNNFSATLCSAGGYDLQKREVLLQCEGPLLTRQRPVSVIPGVRVEGSIGSLVSPFASKSESSRELPTFTRYSSDSRCIRQRLALAPGERAEVAQSPRLGRLVLDSSGQFVYRNDQPARRAGDNDLFVARIYQGKAVRQLRVALLTQRLDDEARCWEQGDRARRS